MHIFNYYLFHYYLFYAYLKNLTFEEKNSCDGACSLKKNRNKINV